MLDEVDTGTPEQDRLDEQFLWRCLENREAVEQFLETVFSPDEWKKMQRRGKPIDLRGH